MAAVGLGFWNSDHVFLKLSSVLGFALHDSSLTGLLELRLCGFKIKYSYVHMKPLLSMFMKGNEVYLTGQNLTLNCS